MAVGWPLSRDGRQSRIPEPLTAQRPSWRDSHLSLARGVGSASRAVASAIAQHRPESRHNGR